MKKYVILVTMVGICLGGFSTRATSAPILQGTTEGSPLGFVTQNFMHGYEFVSTTNQSLTALGFWDEGSNGLPSAFSVGLWNTVSQVLLASVVIDSSDALDTSITVENGQWRYETLSSPVALLSGTNYTLAFQSGGAVLSSTDALLLSYPSLSVNPNVTVSNTTRFLGTSSFVFPTGTGTTNTLFRGNVNAQLQTVPEPAMLPLFGSVLAGLAMSRYRRRRVA